MCLDQVVVIELGRRWIWSGLECMGTYMGGHSDELVLWVSPRLLDWIM